MLYNGIVFNNLNKANNLGWPLTSIDVSQGVKLLVGGQELKLKNEDGNIVKPLIYQDSIYVPIPMISRIFDKDVYWDDSGNTVCINDY